ncbi:MAG: UDP-N-acetylglucosamine pyrophosphorylase [Ruminococcaceae bacterium]|nr:UDP-N-acetylglucosamine pyrophosphorylase [Oscillospiraceae bacterium]
MFTVNELFDLDHTAAAEYLRQFTYPHEALAGISEMILELGRQLNPDEYHHPLDWDGNVLEDVWVANDATVFKTAYLHGPCIIGHGTEVRQCAFVRGGALVGDNCVVGNSTELKNVILFDNVQVPHYNYVGDSILGYKAHMGAGSITSNVKSDKCNVVLRCGDERMETGRKKVGAMLGDRVEIGCNSVLNPGTVVGRDSSVYPVSCVRGTVPANSIWKREGSIAEKK